MSFEVLEVTDRRWDDIVDQLEKPDVHFTSGYMLSNKRDDAVPKMAVWSHWAPLSRKFIAKPFMLREIPQTHLYDVSSVYGYGGILTNYKPNDIRFLASYSAFDSSLTHWYCWNSVVSDFCVHHQDTRQQGIVRKRVAMINLAGDFQTAYRTDRRQNIKRAINNGVDVSIIEQPSAAQIAGFYNLYLATMARRNATARWWLRKEDIYRYCYCMPERLALFEAWIAGEREVSSLVIWGPGRAYYHFTGNAMRNKRSGANDLLIDNIAHWARDKGCTHLHLGGGVSSDPKDSLLDYKASFGADLYDVRTSFKVYNQQAYDCLSTEAQKATGFLPAYRSEHAA